MFRKPAIIRLLHILVSVPSCVTMNNWNEEKKQHPLHLTAIKLPHRINVYDTMRVVIGFFYSTVRRPNSESGGDTQWVLRLAFRLIKCIFTLQCEWSGLEIPHAHPARTMRCIIFNLHAVHTCTMCYLLCKVLCAVMQVPPCCLASLIVCTLPTRMG